MSRPRRSRSRRRADPFRLLALVTIVLGMTIVVVGFVVWYFTNRESSLLIGAGLVMATGGGLRAAAETLLERLPQYQPPPELPVPRPLPTNEGSDA